MALIVLIPRYSSGPGRVFVSEPQFRAAMRAAGYVPVGHFGRAQWPAVVVARVDGDAGVSFRDARGQTHDYRGFSGPLRVLRLKPLRPDGKGRRDADFVKVFGMRATPRTPLD